MKSPVRVVVTGAAGQIGYSLIFRIAAGDMLGPDQPVILHLLEITPALKNLHGVVMELNDCAFPLVAGIVATDDANIAFKDADYAVKTLSKASPMAFMKGMQAGDIKMEGDFGLLMWFNNAAKFMQPEVPKPVRQAVKWVKARRQAKVQVSS